MTDLTLPAGQAAAIYDVLVQHAGASPDGRDEFVLYQTTWQCDDYPFRGSLGPGGNFLITQTTWHVSAWHDDVQRNPNLRDVIAVTNAVLATLRAGYAARGALT
ncbi:MULTISPECIES: hypothetical protein [unclassified Micromonospora]|uniref:hypothetical protein n=1 Tax=unclassified Micromonospora TaxID=2617518 RepID=UPI0033287247